MKRLLPVNIFRWIAVLLLVFSFSAQAELVEPRIDSDSRQVMLGRDAQTALEAWNTSFRLYRFSDYAIPVSELFTNSPTNLPMAMVGNFNRDTSKDVALMGYVRDTEYFLVLLSQPRENRYRVYVVHSSSRPIDDQPEMNLSGTSLAGKNQYLSFLPASFYARIKERYEAAFRKANVRYPDNIDGLQIETFGGTTESFIFDGRRFRAFGAIVGKNR